MFREQAHQHKVSSCSDAKPAHISVPQARRSLRSWHAITLSHTLSTRYLSYLFPALPNQPTADAPELGPLFNCSRAMPERLPHQTVSLLHPCFFLPPKKKRHILYGRSAGYIHSTIMSISNVHFPSASFSASYLCFLPYLHLRYTSLF